MLSVPSLSQEENTELRLFLLAEKARIMQERKVRPDALSVAVAGAVAVAVTGAGTCTGAGAGASASAVLV